jgi:hypothetical protein
MPFLQAHTAFGLETKLEQWLASRKLVVRQDFELILGGDSRHCIEMMRESLLFQNSLLEYTSHNLCVANIGLPTAITIHETSTSQFFSAALPRSPKPQRKTVPRSLFLDRTLGVQKEGR